MVNMIDNDGQPVGPGKPQKQGPTAGPWMFVDAKLSAEYEEWVRRGEWHTLLLKAFLKGWRLNWHETAMDDYGAFLLYNEKAERVGNYLIRENGLPACPDAETYQRIRIAVEGQ